MFLSFCNPYNILGEFRLTAICPCRINSPILSSGSERKKERWERVMAQNDATATAPQTTVKVVAICGSLRKGSFNRGLIRAAMEIAQSIDGLEIEYVDISPLPFLNTDLEVNGTYPPVVEAFRQKILVADAILFSSPDYNYSITGPLKNAIDWASRPPNVWANKAAATVGAAGGTGGQLSQYHLRQIGVFLNLHFINKPEFSLNAFSSPSKFDGDGNLIDSSTKDRLKEVLLSLLSFTLLLQPKLR